MVLRSAGLAELADIAGATHERGRGAPIAPVTWMFIHSAIIATGLVALRTSSSRV
jgi:hypothetical protein